jgi:SAM-dependent methyltransferase
MQVHKMLLLSVLFMSWGSVVSWFPGNYPFDPRIHTFGNHGMLGKFHAKIAPYFTKIIDMSVYGKDVRQDTYNKYRGKDILDFGCGTGFSTAESMGSVGVDTSKEMIEEAEKLFPMKTFEYGHAEYYEPEKTFDVVTSMFLMHEVPQFARKRIINNACSIATETVVILDIAPEYKPSKLMLAGEPYLPDYLKNIRSDLEDFKEEVLVPGHVHMWTKDLIQDKYFEGDEPISMPKKDVDYRGVPKIDF